MESGSVCGTQQRTSLWENEVYSKWGEILGAAVGADIREKPPCYGQAHILVFCVCLNILENEVYFPIKIISMLRFSSLSSNVYNSYFS